MLAISDRALRASVRNSLYNRGLKTLQEANALDDAHNGLRSGQIDLLIATAEIEGGDIGAMLQEMRHNRIGENPFVIVMTLLDNPNTDLVQRVVETGTDDVMLMPMLPAQLVARLDNFVSGRKPFVITHDYIGPDRRILERQGVKAAPRLEVPNPVRWQVVANADRTPLHLQIRDSSMILNMHKMKRYCIQITWLVERIVRAYFADAQAEMLADAVSLGVVAEDLAQRMRGTVYSQASELVLSLCALCDRLAREDRLARRVEVEILPTLARAVARVFDEDGETAVASPVLAV
jgi:DNA-binding response OmpR family regulator